MGNNCSLTTKGISGKIWVIIRSKGYTKVKLEEGTNWYYHYHWGLDNTKHLRQGDKVDITYDTKKVGRRYVHRIINI